MDPADLPSVTATMPATGAVCPRNKARVAKTSPKGDDCPSVVLCETLWKMRLAEELAKAIMLRLNAICCGLKLAFFRGQHCTVVEMHVMTRASTALRFIAAVSRNGKLTDMLPLMPGSFTFIRDVVAASARTPKAR